MSFRVQCQHCGAGLVLPADPAGRDVRCPTCSKTSHVPLGGPAKPPAPPPEHYGPKTTPWKIVVGVLILVFVGLSPLWVSFVFGSSLSSNVMLLQFHFLLMVGLGYVVATMNESALTFLYVILCTGILPGVLIIAGWLALLEGLGHDYRMVRRRRGRRRR
jgi:hypothetical protein